MNGQLGLAGRLAKAFLNSKLTPLIIVTSLAIGIFAVAVIPREEDPQILVPMLDIVTAMPGASPAEIEQHVTAPIETLVHQISGVEYVYSTSSPGQSLVIVRFLVGTPQEDALIKVYSKLYSNFDRLPPGASQPIIKARSIDDVPILAVTLSSSRYDDFELRRVPSQGRAHTHHRDGHRRGRSPEPGAPDGRQHARHAPREGANGNRVREALRCRRSIADEGAPDALAVLDRRGCEGLSVLSRGAGIRIDRSAVIYSIAAIVPETGPS